MAKTVTGVVERITKDVTKTGKNAGKAYYKVKVNDCEKLLFVWDWPIIKDVQIGAEAEFAVDDSGDFWTAHSAVPVIRGDGAHAQNAIGAPPAAAGMDLKNLYMARESALKSAVEFIKSHPTFAETIEDAVSIAGRFFEYIESGK